MMIMMMMISMMMMMMRGGEGSVWQRQCQRGAWRLFHAGQYGADAASNYGVLNLKGPFQLVWLNTGIVLCTM